MNRCPTLLALLFLTGCASTSSGPAPGPAARAVQQRVCTEPRPYRDLMEGGEIDWRVYRAMTLAVAEVERRRAVDGWPIVPSQCTISVGEIGCELSVSFGNPTRPNTIPVGCAEGPCFCVEVDFDSKDLSLIHSHFVR